MLKIISKTLKYVTNSLHIYYINKNINVQGASQKLLLTTKEPIVSSSIFSGPPCIHKHNKTI